MVAQDDAATEDEAVFGSCRIDGSSVTLEPGDSVGEDICVVLTVGVATIEIRLLIVIVVTVGTTLKVLLTMVISSPLLLVALIVVGTKVVTVKVEKVSYVVS